MLLRRQLRHGLFQTCPQTPFGQCDIANLIELPFTSLSYLSPGGVDACSEVRIFPLKVDDHSIMSKHSMF